VTGFSNLYRRTVVLLLLFAVPIVIGLSVSDYSKLLICYIIIWSILAISWNVFCGYTGLISFGHAIYWGIGAYSLGIGVSTFGLPPPVAIVAGVILAVVASLIIGLPTLRLTGAYFSLAMLAYPLVTMSVVTWLGYGEIFLPFGESAWWNLRFSQPIHYIVLSSAVLAVAFLISIQIHSSRLGHCLRSIRESESAAASSGIDVWRCKLIANTLSAAIAAVAGSLYGLVLGVMTTENSFGFMVSAQAVVLPLFGGVGSPWGPIIGAGVLVPSAEWLNATFGDRLPGISGLVYGLALIVIVLAAPEGIYWKVRDLFHARRGPASDAGVETFEESAAEMTIFDKPGEGTIHHSADSEKADATVLEVFDLAHSFGGVKALSAVSLKVKKGTIHCIVGPNGAGKTTLFNILSGFIHPSAGRALVHGIPMIGMKPHEVARAGVARTFQVPRIFPRMSVLENVQIGAYAGSLNDAESLHTSRAALATVGLLQRSQEAAGTLSTYEVRLLEIARGLACRPRLFLMDEVFAGIGKAEAVKIEALLLSLRDNGITIVIIEHTMDSMLRISDAFTVIDHGKTIISGKPREVVKNPSVIKAYLGEKWSENA
jgi:branched-chain amino acid transport system permease protein